MRQWLLRESSLGLEWVPRPPRDAPRERRAAPPGPPLAAEPDLPSTPVEASSRVTGAEDLLVDPEIRSARTLDELRDVLGDCERCKLCSHRTRIVFGVGNPNADLMFIGEGPGEDEDRQGVPFVGRAGMLLTDIITKGMGLSRDDVYIANVVKCRPPNNRNPEPDEIVACEPFLHQQIRIVKPKVIVTLGKFASQVLLRTRTPISRLRGQWHEYDGVAVLPTFHPAYLLRNPADKKLVWEDIKQVMRRLGLALAHKQGAR